MSPRYRILIVEDDSGVGPALRSRLSTDYDVALAATLSEADRILATSTFDLIVLDVTLPDGDGFHFCGKLRTQAAHQNTPIIFLTGHASIDDKILGLSIGADDYLNKPFHVEELKLRITAILRRSQGAKSHEHEGELTFGDLVVDVRYYKVEVRNDTGTESVHLTALEFKLLHFLASRNGEVCSREQLIREIWGANVHVTERTIDTHLTNLRKKLVKSAWTVQAVHGFGYHWTQRNPRIREAS